MRRQTQPNMKYSPAIVVVAYNRPHSLKRLLSSLANARKADGARLIISIDNNGSENQPVVDIAKNFNWPFGEKEVIHQPVKLGLTETHPAMWRPVKKIRIGDHP